MGASSTAPKTPQPNDDIVDRAVNQLSLVSTAMKMLLESCERALLEAAEDADPGPHATPKQTVPVHGSGRRFVAHTRRPRLRAR